MPKETNQLFSMSLNTRYVEVGLLQEELPMNLVNNKEWVSQGDGHPFLKEGGKRGCINCGSKVMLWSWFPFS